MRLTPKKIEEMLRIILGEEGLPLVRELTGKENVSEFDLATKTKQDIKIIRKMLYVLYNHNLVGFTRKKDKQKGWYIYYWTLLPENIRFIFYKTKRDLLQHLKGQLEEEEREIFFVCPNSCVRLNFDQATDFEFRCPECGELISQDEERKIEKLKKRIKELEQEISELSEKRKIKRKIVKEGRKTKKVRIQKGKKQKKSKKI